MSDFSSMAFWVREGLNSCSVNSPHPPIFSLFVDIVKSSRFTSSPLSKSTSQLKSACFFLPPVTSTASINEHLATFSTFCSLIITITFISTM